LITALVLALCVTAPPDRYDTVYLTTGGVVRGTVLEDVPGADVVLETPDGKVRKIPRSAIAGVQYAGTAPAEPGPLVPVPPPPPTGPPGLGEPPGPGEPAPPEAPARSLDEVTAFQVAAVLGVAFPVGQLSSAGPDLGSAVTPQLTGTFEFSYRPIVDLELGAYILFGLGSSRPPLNDYCLAAGAWCDAYDLAVGLFPRWSFLPRGAVNPWVMIGGGFEWLSVSNEYHDSFDYTGWQVGGAVGVDLRSGPLWGLGFQLGTRWGQFTSRSVTGPLPALPGGAAMHGWIDLGVRGSFGF
jgi:hypothetical protein